MLNDKELTQKKIIDNTQKAIEELVVLSLKSKIKLDKNEYKLTKFIRDNIGVFIKTVEKYTSYHIEFIHTFLLNCGVEEQKNTITTVYNRVKKEHEIKKQKTIFSNKDNKK